MKLHKTEELETLKLKLDSLNPSLRNNAVVISNVLREHSPDEDLDKIIEALDEIAESVDGLPVKTYLHDLVNKINK